MAIKATCSVTLSAYRDTQSVTRYYKVQSSTAASPSKPTTNPPSGWTNTEPSYTSGSTNTLYFCDLTVFSDGTWAYSTVSKSSSYEAAKEAWNKANNAQNTANTANNKIDSLKIGGRNYFSNRSKKAFDENNEFQLADYQNKGSFTQFYNLTQPMSYFVGKSVILSFDVISPNGETPISVYNSNGNPRYIMSVTGIESPINNTWIHQELTISVSDRGDSADYSVENSNKIEFYCSARMDCKIRNVKFEIGNSATDWTPAPEDIDDRLTSTETRITSAETSIENNSTEISLKASQTEVTAVANNLNAYIDRSTQQIQTVNGWQFNWDKLIRTAEADVANHQDYITLQNGDIIFGESASDLKLKVSNDAIQFKGTADTEVTPDSDATAWITGNKFHINEGEIHNTLKVGKLQFTPRPNGNFAISVI